MPNRKDLTGQKIGQLTILEFAYSKDFSNGKRAYWRCLCDCGVEKVIAGTDLRIGHTSSCGCAWKRRKSEHPNWRGFGEISASWWRQFLGQRFRRNKKKEVEISIEEAWQKFLDQDKLCKFTGIELKFDQRERKNHTASIDRIDSDGHYTLDNVQWIHKQVNIMKNDLSDEEFINWCCLIADHYRNNKNA